MSDTSMVEPTMGGDAAPTPRTAVVRAGDESARWSSQGITEGQATRPVLGREGAYRRALAVADVLSAVLALGLVALVAAPSGAGALIAFAPLLVVINKVAGLYDRDDLVINKTTLDEAPALLQISGLFTLLTWMGHEAFVDDGLAPASVLVLWVLLLSCTLIARTLARRLVSRWALAERCLVVGASESADALAVKLETAGVHAEVVARIPLDSHGGVASVSPEDVPALVDRYDVHRLVFAPLASDGGDMLDLIRAAKGAGVRVSVMPRMLEVVGSSVEFDHLDGLTMLGVRSFGLSRSSRALKRAFDLLCAVLLTAAVAPIMGLVALAVRLDSHGPIFFRQTRMGRDGNPFEILKFRSMVVDAEDRKDGLRHLNETDGLFKLASDPRITRVGRFIRSTSLDELPQLLNVLRGDMSLVGPRPLVLDEDARIVGLDRGRLHLTPGMTGHWQILGSARVPLEEMVGIDYLYVANWSLWTDIKILLRTLRYVALRGGV